MMLRDTNMHLVKKWSAAAFVEDYVIKDGKVAHAITELSEISDKERNELKDLYEDTAGKMTKAVSAAVSIMKKSKLLKAKFTANGKIFTLTAAGGRDTVDGKEGRWITVRGTKVFIEDGQSEEDAIKERFGKSKPKQTKPKKIAGWVDKEYMEGIVSSMWHESDSDDDYSEDEEQDLFGEGVAPLLNYSQGVGEQRSDDKWYETLYEGGSIFGARYSTAVHDLDKAGLGYTSFVTMDAKERAEYAKENPDAKPYMVQLEFMSKTLRDFMDTRLKHAKVLWRGTRIGELDSMLEDGATIGSGSDSGFVCISVNQRSAAEFAMWSNSQKNGGILIEFDKKEIAKHIVSQHYTPHDIGDGNNINDSQGIGYLYEEEHRLPLDTVPVSKLKNTKIHVNTNLDDEQKKQFVAMYGKLGKIIFDTEVEGWL